MAEIMQVAQSRGADSDAPHLWRGLVGAWPLQEGGGNRIWDVSGSRNHGTLYGNDIGAAWGLAFFGRHLRCNGNDVYVLGNPVGSITKSRGWSVSAWVRQRFVGTGDNQYPRIVNSVDNQLKWLIALGDSSLWAAYNDGTEYRREGDALTLNQWHHVVAVFSANGIAGVTLYINGRLVTTDRDPGRVNWANTGLYFGRRGDGQQRLNGDLCDVLIYDYTLSQAAITSLYADPWAMYRLRHKIHPAIVAALPPTVTQRRSQLLGSGLGV